MATNNCMSKPQMRCWLRTRRLGWVTLAAARFILVDTCSCCFGRHIAFLETCKCVPVLSSDWRQHRSESQVDAFTCFGRILNLLEDLLLPDRIVECRNDLCSTGPISAQRHIQVAEFRCACL